MSVQELELAVAQLPREDFVNFQAWFEEFVADAWDAQIEADAQAGKLDHLAEVALAEFRAGQYTRLP